MDVKTCSTCKEDKPVSEFYKNSGHSDGLASRCKKCHDGGKSDATRSNKKKLLKAARDMGFNICSSCDVPKPLSEFYPGEHRCKKCESERASRYNRKVKTGWTQEDYDRAYSIQGGCCDICHRQFDVLSADHCHSKNKKRGLLCTECNLLLGKAKDDVRILKSAIAYLERHEA